MSDPTNTRGTPGPDEEADVASGGAPERLDTSAEPEASKTEEQQQEHGSEGGGEEPDRS